MKQIQKKVITHIKFEWDNTQKKNNILYVKYFYEYI